MIIYHGSEKVIEKPVFGQGKKYNDYGLGFYCTESQEMAREWAVGEDRNGFANKYELNMKGMKVLDLNDGNYCLLHWLTILLENRTFRLDSPLAREAFRYLKENFHLDYENVDIIKGYRADDSYFSFAEDFINGNISYRQLGIAMKLGKLGEQVVMKSQKAFDAIEFKGYEVVFFRDYYESKKMRDVMARKSYFDMDREAYVKGDLYIVQILDEEMKADDSRLQ